MKRTFPSWKMLREVSSPFISPRARGCRTSGGCGGRATWRCWLRPGSRLTTCSCWTPSWCSATSPPSCSRGGLVLRQHYRYNHLWLFLQIQIQISNKVERFPNRRCARQRGSEHYQVHGTHRTIMVDNQIHINDQLTILNNLSGCSIGLTCPVTPSSSWPSPVSSLICGSERCWYAWTICTLLKTRSRSTTSSSETSPAPSAPRK